MNRNKYIGLFLVVAFLLGALVTVILTSPWNFTHPVIASPDSRSVPNDTGRRISDSPIFSGQQEELITKLNGVFVQAAQQVKPSVVTVFSERVIRVQQWNPFEYFFGDEFYEQFFGRRPPRRQREQKKVLTGMGSGVIVKADGIILTNYHVVKDADDIRVKTTDGKEYPGEVVGSDPKTDIAIIRIKATQLPVAPLGDSDKLQVGEWVLAIGNPFSEELRYTVTKGIVSATGRTGLGLANGQGYENFIQTDAPINPGNSGGALVNLHGQVVGINTAIVSPSGGFAGIGFAIPINMARKVMNDLLTKGKVVRGWLGVAIQTVDADMARALDLKVTRGVIVSDVTKGGPADKAGIKRSDVIVEFNGKSVRNMDQLKFMVAEVPPGTRVDVVVNRNGREQTLKVVIGERSEEATTPTVARETSKKLGIEVANVTEEYARRYEYEVGSGVVITDVDPTSDAYRKGLREGMLIKELNRKKVRDVDEFNEVMKSVKPGNVVLFLVQQGKNNFFVAIEIPKD